MGTIIILDVKKFGSLIILITKSRRCYTIASILLGREILHYNLSEQCVHFVAY